MAINWEKYIDSVVTCHRDMMSHGIVVITELYAVVSWGQFCRDGETT